MFADRVGIAQEILAALARRAFNVTAVEVEPPRIFIEVPALDAAGLDDLRAELLRVAGVQRVGAVGMLPGAQRRLYLDALLASLPDPVFAVDEHGVIVLANRAAELLCAGAGAGIGALVGQPLQTALSLEVLPNGLAGQAFHQPAIEIAVRGEPYLLEATPLHEAGGRTAGGVVTLHAPSRMGERLSALHNARAGGFDAILGVSEALQHLKARAARMALVDAPLLITGETGTGKELLAHACHAASARSRQPFFALNCAALPESLAESELFGYAPGAFSGALRSGKPGLLELADGGTVFLDEVGEMSPYLQAKLLRFLNDGSFRRVGGEREVRADVRIISATHRLLDQMADRGEFRRDLLFRLDVLALHLPPLRERPEDILPLARAALARACAQTGRPELRLSPAACTALQANPWPGNVRQLQNVIFRAVTMCDRSVIEAGDLELAGASGAQGTKARAEAPAPDPAAAPWQPERIDTLEQAVADFEKALLQRLHAEHPSTRRLAQRLGTSHSAIAVRLRRYGIGS